MTVSKEKLLLHSCCGPCSTAVIERLADDFDITVFYYNPNITDKDEYEHRKAEEIRFIAEYSEKTGHSIAFIEGDYDPEEYYKAAKGLEQEREGGARCSECFRLRLMKTALLAKEKGFDLFDTTLTVSPYKNYDVISAIASDISEKTGVRYLSGNYKKKDGYKRSIELSKEYGLYRQHYCGCEFSKRTNENE
jgi:hypothetical protein